MKTGPKKVRKMRIEPRPSRPDDGNAFFPDTIGQLRPLASADAEAFAEEFIDSATGAGSIKEDAADEVGEDEDGGPFILLDDEGRLPPEPVLPRSMSRSTTNKEARPEPPRRGALWASHRG